MELLLEGVQEQDGAASEFFWDNTVHVVSKWYPQGGPLLVDGACGPNSVYHSVCARNKVAPTMSGFEYTMRQMRGLGYCDQTGISRMDQLVGYLAHTGVPLSIEPKTGKAAYVPCLTDDYGRVIIQRGPVQELLDAHAGISGPILYMTSHGQVLTDAVSGLGERAYNLQEHFVCVVGQHQGGFSKLAQRTLPAGYWVRDGDAFALPWGGVGPLVFYPVQVLANTNPIAAAVVALPVTPPKSVAPALAPARSVPVVPASPAAHSSTTSAPAAVTIIGSKGFDALSATLHNTLPATAHGGDDQFSAATFAPDLTMLYHYGQAPEARPHDAYLHDVVSHLLERWK